MKRLSTRIRILVIALTASVAVGRSAADTPPDARALIERYEKEKSPVWADGDTATFFYRGDAEQVTLDKDRSLVRSASLSASLSRPEARSFFRAGGNTACTF